MTSNSVLRKFLRYDKIVNMEFFKSFIAKKILIIYGAIFAAGFVLGWIMAGAVYILNGLK